MKERYFNTSNIDIVSQKIFDEILPYSKSYRTPINSTKIALLIIDMQDFFLKENGKGYIPSAPPIIPKISALQEVCIDKGIDVYLSKHINTKADAGMMAVRWKELITKEDPSSQIIDKLNLKECKLIIKSQFDVFYKTDLEEKLRRNNIEQLIITGVMTNLCCETTVRSAFVRGFDPIFPIDTTAAYNYNFHLGSFRTLSYGFTSPILSNQVMEGLK